MIEMLKEWFRFAYNETNLRKIRQFYMVFPIRDALRLELNWTRYYHYILKCFVLIDLKMNDLTHQDLGQMQMHVNYYTREMMNEGDNPPIGIILCADKSDAIVKYTLAENNRQIFASKYQIYLPTEKELIDLITEEKNRLLGDTQ